jgi:hypothetical protein
LAKTPQSSIIVPKKAGQKKESATLKTAPADVQKCKQYGIETHLQENNTRSNYARHICRGWKWLVSHFDNLSKSAISKNTSKDSPTLMLSLPPSVAIDADNDVNDDPAFKDMFNRISNRCSDKALALFMSLKGFHENLSKMTVKSICLAFKKLWKLL